MRRYWCYGSERRYACRESLSQAYVRPLIGTTEPAHPECRRGPERRHPTFRYRQSLAYPDPGVDPCAEVAGYRNRLAHASPGDLSSDRIWTDTTVDLGSILAELYRRLF